VWRERVVSFARTDVGVKRSHNQDAYGIRMAANDAAWRRRGHVFVVADGMGAHAVGELASKMAVQAIEHTYPRLKDDDPKEALKTAFTFANDTIHEKGNQNPEFRGMGTTATTLVLLPEGAVLGHVGDSRCYRIRRDVIEQLSYDHSLQWELARQKHVTPEEMSHIPSNVIVRSLGPQPEVKTDTAGPYPVQNGDRFLLCSDGLSGLVTDAEMWAVVNAMPGDEASQFLVDLANLRGGVDNITLILVQVGEPNSESAGTPVLERPSMPARLKKTFARIPSEWRYFVAGILTALSGGLLYWIGDWRIRTAFFLAALLLLSVAYWTHRRRRKREERKDFRKAHETPENPIHRSRPCTLDRNLIDMAAGAERRLRELAVEQSWRVAWDDLAKCRTAAEAALSENKLEVAFRYYCRGVSLLSEGLRKHQDKQEVLIPHWDRAPKG